VRAVHRPPPVLRVAAQAAPCFLADLAAQDTTLTTYVLNRKFKAEKNKRECLTLARIFEFLEHELPMSVRLEDSGALEVLFRRLMALFEAEANGDRWDVAMQYEEIPYGMPIGPQKMREDAHKAALLVKKLQTFSKSEKGKKGKAAEEDEE
jgi:hypothetical protein